MVRRFTLRWFTSRDSHRLSPATWKRSVPPGSGLSRAPLRRHFENLELSVLNLAPSQNNVNSKSHFLTLEGAKILVILDPPGSRSVHEHGRLCHLLMLQTRWTKHFKRSAATRLSGRRQINDSASGLPATLPTTPQQHRFQQRFRLIARDGV